MSAISVIVNAIVIIIGMIASAALDVAVLCALAAIPLAALMYLGLIGQATVYSVMVIIAIILTGRVVLVTAFNLL